MSSEENFLLIGFDVRDGPSVIGIISPDEDEFAQKMLTVTEERERYENEMASLLLKKRFLLENIAEEEASTPTDSSLQSEEFVNRSAFPLPLDPHEMRLLETAAEKAFPDYNRDKDCPDHFVCPIYSTRFHNPVLVLETGQSYEEQSITTWLSGGVGTPDPLTRKPIKMPLTEAFKPNEALKQALVVCEKQCVEQIHQKRKSYVAQQIYKTLLHSYVYSSLYQLKKFHCSTVRLSELKDCDTQIALYRQMVNNRKAEERKLILTRTQKILSEQERRRCACYHCNVSFSLNVFCYPCERCKHYFCATCSSYSGCLSDDSYSTSWVRICICCYWVNRRRLKNNGNNTIPGDNDSLPTYLVACATDKTYSYALKIFFARTFFEKMYERVVLSFSSSVRVQ